MKAAIIDKATHHRLQLFVALAISVSVILVIISMGLYYSSNAYKLDLSRPEYIQVRSQIEKDPKDSSGFSEQGVINREVLDDFLNKYHEEESNIVDSKAFEGDVLSDERLGIVELNDSSVE